MVASGLLSFDAISSLRGISITTVSDVDALYRSVESSARADSLEAACMRLVDDIKQENQQETIDMTNQDALLLPAAQVRRLLSSAARSIFGGMKLASNTGTKLISLAWNDTYTASLELDDASTLNAMTSSLLENLGRCLAAAFASEKI